MVVSSSASYWSLETSLEKASDLQGKSLFVGRQNGVKVGV